MERDIRADLDGYGNRLNKNEKEIAVMQSQLSDTRIDVKTQWDIIDKIRESVNGLTVKVACIVGVGIGINVVVQIFVK